MSKASIYLTRNFPGDAVNMLKKEFEVVINPEDRPVSREELLENIKGKKGVICQATDRIDREVLEAAAAEGVRGFANYAVGYDNIDVKAASELHIQISNTPDVLTDATAEMAWALLFTAARKTAESDRFIRSGKMGRDKSRHVPGRGNNRKNSGDNRRRKNRNINGAQVPGF